MENITNKEVSDFVKTEVKKLNQFWDLFPKDLLFQIHLEIFREFDEAQKKKFEDEVLFIDPVVLRTFFTVYTPPEEYELRLRAYKLSNPKTDHSRLLLLAKYLRSSGWKTYLRNLARAFLNNAAVDFQKEKGKPGNIIDLRQKYFQKSKLKDGTVKIERDCWPRFRLIELWKAKGVELHFYLLQKETEYEFDNFVDEFLIEWMQTFRDDQELRDASHNFQGETRKYHVYVYDVNGKPLNEFPFALKEKYEPLIKKRTGSFPISNREVAKQEAEETFFKSIFKYTKKKGSPPGYFDRSIKHRLFELKEEAKKRSELEGKSLDEKTEKGISILEGVRSEPKSDSALVEEALANLEIKDPIDKIIAENYGRNSQMISDIIYETLGKLITKQAIEKRRQTHIIPMMKKARVLEIRRTMAEDEGRHGYAPPVDKTPEEIEEEAVREKFESRSEGQPEQTGKEEEQEE